MKKNPFYCWPHDGGQYGVRLDLDCERKCDLPPCPGLGGWKAADETGTLWESWIKGAPAEELARKLNSTPDGFYQYVVVFHNEEHFIFETEAEENHA